jgi:hypothetical protein
MPASQALTADPDRHAYLGNIQRLHFLHLSFEFCTSSVTFPANYARGNNLFQLLMCLETVPPKLKTRVKADRNVSLVAVIGMALLREL